MQPRTVRCPQCETEFPTQRSPGMQVNCPSCLTYFAVPLAAAAPPQAPSIVPEPIAEPPPEPIAVVELPPIAIPEVEATPAAPHPKPAKAKKPSAPPVLAYADESPEPAGESRLGLFVICLMLLGILAGGGYGLHWFLNHRPQPDAEIASLEPTEKTDPKPIATIAPAPPAPTNSEPKTPEPNPTPMPTPPETKDEPKVRPIVNDDPHVFFNPIASARLGPTGTSTWVVPGVEAKRIERAIEQGVEFLRRSQQTGGTWKTNGHPVGYAALPGLVLLECKVLPSDPAVQAAARFVRSQGEKLNGTYELSLAILFLDRLGDSRDRGLIQMMALRLVAGQTDRGGWSYTCPVLTKDEAVPLLALLQRTKPNVPTLDPLALPREGFNDPLTTDKPALNDPLAAKPNTPLNIPLQGFGPDRFPIPFPAQDDPQAKDDPRPIQPVEAKDEIPTPMPGPPKKEEPAAPKKMLLKPKSAPLRPEAVPPSLRDVPAVAKLWSKKRIGKMRLLGDDNSNTQFALLALWTARRHGVPTESALMVADERFSTNQNVDGGWGYSYSSGSSPSMTCVGLLGLAMGHGAKGVIPKAGAAPSAEDAAIQNGLRKLGSHLGEPVPTPRQGLRMENLYMLWSVERVAMLYNLKTIGAKDWYGWGAQILVVNQGQDGSWPHSAHFHGAEPVVNTCFALLFLKRSNLVQDLTENLRLQMAITDPDRAPGRP